MGVEQTYKLQRRSRDQGGKERPGRAEKDRGVIQLALRFHNVRGGGAQREQHVVRHERLQLAVVGEARRQFAGEPHTWQAEQMPAAGRAPAQPARCLGQPQPRRGAGRRLVGLR